MTYSLHREVILAASMKANAHSHTLSCVMDVFSICYVGQFSSTQVYVALKEGGKQV